MTFLLPNQLNMQSTGLYSKEVQKSHRQYGKNTLTQKPRKTFLHQFLSAFNDPIIKILVIALALNVIITFNNLNFYEPMGIALSLFLATFVQALSEYGSESAFLKMQQESDATDVIVIRDTKADHREHRRYCGGRSRRFIGRCKGARRRRHNRRQRACRYVTVKRRKCRKNKASLCAVMQLVARRQGSAFPRLRHNVRKL